jgi:hypothetical protein
MHVLPQLHSDLARKFMDFIIFLIEAFFIPLVGLPWILLRVCSWPDFFFTAVYKLGFICS